MSIENIGAAQRAEQIAKKALGETSKPTQKHEVMGTELDSAVATTDSIESGTTSQGEYGGGVADTKAKPEKVMTDDSKTESVEDKIIRLRNETGEFWG